MKKYLISLIVLITSFNLTQAQTWSAKQSLPSTARTAAPGFAIGNIGYIVGGETGPVNLTDFWAYNSVTDTWSAKPSFPGTPKVKAVAFSINGIGYYGLGNDSTFYKFDPITNTWTQLATPHFGISYWSSMYFTIGNDAYFLFASTNIFAKYNTITNTWSTLANFPGPLRFTGSGFSISSKGYITCGINTFGSPYLNDLWEYTPSTNTWSIKAPLPATGRYAAISYSMNGLGYLLCGERFSPNVTLDEFWQYNPVTNSWTALPSFIAGARNYLSGFVICNNIYAGFGGFGYHNDFYMYGSNTLTITSSATAICAGGTTTLTSSGATSYTWMPGSIVSASAIVSPTTTTTYTVTGVNVSGCVNTKTISITVNSNPTVSVLGSSSGICIGATATLSATGATSYTWSPGGLTNGTITVNPTSTTIYTVTGLAGTCTKTQTINLNVSAIPSISLVATSNTVCVGSNVVIYASGASTYTWNPGSVSGATVLAIPLVSSTYTVNGNNGLGCIGTKTLNMTVNPKPIVNASSSATAICSGNSVIVSASGATSYTWMPGSIIGTNATVSPTTSTTYTVTGVNASGCVNTKTISVIVNPNPIVSVLGSSSGVCLGATATLSASGATSYTWSPGGLTTGTIAVTPSTTTVYTVTGLAGTCAKTQTINLNVSANAPTYTVTPLIATLTCLTNTIFVSALTGLNTTAVWSNTTTPNFITGSAGTYSVLLTNTISLCKATIPVTIISNTTIPSISLVASSNTICSGSSAVLYASGASTYTWNPGSVSGATLLVSPMVSSTYTVNGNNGLGCIGTKTLNLTVNSCTGIIPPSLIINEVSQGIGGNKEYVELLVAGTPACNVIPSMDLRDYYIDDNNGAHGTGGTGVGCVRFSNNVFWSNIPIGTLILIYNDADFNPSYFPFLNDLSMSDGNCRLVIPINDTTLFESHTTLPNTLSTSYPTTGFIAGGNWNYVTMGNMGDSFHVVNPFGSIISSVSWATNNLATNIYFSATQNGSVIAMTNAVNNSYSLQSNWINSVCPIGETPGAPNTLANAAWINSMNNSCMPLTPLVTTKGVNNGCACNGSATITPTGAIGPYTYTWSPSGGSGAIATGLCPGNYSVNVRSYNGCLTTTTLSIASTTTALVVNSPTVCSGSSANLIVSGATTYTWNTGATNSSILITPTVTTNYTVSGTNSSGCVNTKTLSVTVNPKPIVTAATTATAICAGSAATFSAAGAISYTWMPGGIVGVSATVSPTTSTSYTVTGVNANGCTNTKTLSLMVNPNPILVPVTVAASICSGNSVTMSAGGATSYTWMPGSIYTATATVSPTISSTFTVTGMNANGCKKTQVCNVTVYPNPIITAVTTATAICVGGAVTISSSGATSYTWMPGSIIGANATVSPTISTTYTVTAANINGCINTKTVNVTVNPNPIISASTTATAICIGATTTLNASGAISYTWMPGNIVGVNATVSPTTSTTYTVNGVNTNGCTNTKTLNITVNTKPIVTTASSATTICVGNSATISATGATTYTWMPGNIIGANATVSPTISTSYTVTGVNINGCTNTKTLSITVNPCTGINENEYRYSFIIFPNPVKTELNINTDINYSSLLIINSMSQVITKNEKINILNIENLSQGIYIIQLLNKEHEVIISKKFIKD